MCFLVSVCLCTASTDRIDLWLGVRNELHASIGNIFTHQFKSIYWLQEIQQERLRLQSEQLLQADSLGAGNGKQQAAKAKILIVAQEVCIQLACSTTFLCLHLEPRSSAFSQKSLHWSRSSACEHMVSPPHCTVATINGSVCSCHCGTCLVTPAEFANHVCPNLDILLVLTAVTHTVLRLSRMPAQQQGIVLCYVCV